MEYREMAEGCFILKAAAGEELIGALSAFVNEKKIFAGFLSGIGAASEAEIGYFDDRDKSYHKQTIPGPLEIIALTGNVSRLEDGQAMVHPHVALSLKDMSMRGGHLFRAVVEPTCEMVLKVLPGAIERRLVPEVGLKLWHL